MHPQPRDGDGRRACQFQTALIEITGFLRFSEGFYIALFPVRHDRKQKLERGVATDCLCLSKNVLSSIGPRRTISHTVCRNTGKTGIPSKTNALPRRWFGPLAFS